MLTVLIPMAGQGSRFKSGGYDTPKPLIEVAGQTLAERSIKTLGLPNAHYVFITRSFDKPEDNEKLTEIFTNNCKTFTEVRVDSNHLGAAHSALYAEKYIDSDSELIITNCDQSLRWDPDKFLNEVYDNDWDGAVVLFKSNNPQNSFVRLQGNLVTEIEEKKAISDDALIGVHYWKNASDFFDSGRKLINTYQNLGYKEPYISISYKHLLNDKKILGYHLTDDERYYSLGTPQDINNYLNINNKEFLDLDVIQHTATYGELVFRDTCPAHSVIKDVEITSPEGSGQITIEHGFLFNANENGFYHAIADVIGQYLVLKSFVDEIVPIYIELDSGLTMQKAPKFMKEIIDLGIVSLLTVPKSIKTIKIKNLYIISPRDFQLFYKLFMNYIPEILTEESNPGNRDYIKRLLDPVSSAIISKTKIAKEKNYKIFIHSSNKKMGDGSGSIDESDKRFASKEKYDKIVNEYAELGYEIIDPEELSFTEQVAIVQKASHIVTFKSSNSIHSIYAGRSTQFTMINLSEGNTFPHEVVVKEFIENPKFIDRTDNEEI